MGEQLHTIFEEGKGIEEKSCLLPSIWGIEKKHRERGVEKGDLLEHFFHIIPLYDSFYGEGIVFLNVVKLLKWKLNHEFGRNIDTSLDMQA